MSLFNDKLKEITLKEILVLIIVLFIFQYFFNALNIVHIDAVWIYILIIFYFIFKLKDEFPSAKEEVLDVFSLNIIKTVLAIVVLNIFFSYGMLYFSDFILSNVSSLNFASHSFLTTSLIATIIVSPIVEELIFRGVFLNRLQLIIPPLFAVLVSSLLFASLHTFGSMFSAFVFGICLSILYLKTNNIFVPILAHFLNNLFAETIVALDPGNILFTNNPIVLTISCLALISFAILLVSIIKEMKKL